MDSYSALYLIGYTVKIAVKIIPVKKLFPISLLDYYHYRSTLIRKSSILYFTDQWKQIPGQFIPHGMEDQLTFDSIDFPLSEVIVLGP